MPIENVLNADCYIEVAAGRRLDASNVKEWRYSSTMDRRRWYPGDLPPWPGGGLMHPDDAPSTAALWARYDAGNDQGDWWMPVRHYSPNEQLGDLLRDQIKERKLTITSWAKRSGVHRERANQIAAGTHGPTARLLRILEIAGLTIVKQKDVKTDWWSPGVHSDQRPTDLPSEALEVIERMQRFLENLDSRLHNLQSDVKRITVDDDS